MNLLEQQLSWTRNSPQPNPLPHHPPRLPPHYQQCHQQCQLLLKCRAWSPPVYRHRVHLSLQSQALFHLFHQHSNPQVVHLPNHLYQPQNHHLIILHLFHLFRQQANPQVSHLPNHLHHPQNHHLILLQCLILQLYPPLTLAVAMNSAHAPMKNFPVAAVEEAVVVMVQNGASQKTASVVVGWRGNSLTPQRRFRSPQCRQTHQSVRWTVLLKTHVLIRIIHAVERLVSAAIPTNGAVRSMGVRVAAMATSGESWTSKIILYILK
mmetsp:Transcript_20985/g.42331  ORF Transcript_20985/g.42331 Transcript_20985/m.42331 type:complete len:265 (+) Transcript_20985:512-1306(+)